MSRPVQAFVAAIAYLLTFTALAQSPSEAVVRNFLLEEVRPHIVHTSAEQTRKSGLDRSENRAFAERASAAIVECFMEELELLALTNNIERTLFMDALAFAIAWDTDDEFIRQFEGSELLTANARACIEHGLIVEGVEVRR